MYSEGYPFERTNFFRVLMYWFATYKVVEVFKARIYNFGMVHGAGVQLADLFGGFLPGLAFWVVVQE